MGRGVQDAVEDEATRLDVELVFVLAARGNLDAGHKMVGRDATGIDAVEDVHGIPFLYCGIFSPKKEGKFSRCEAFSPPFSFVCPIL